jgi:hypothetical protein
LKARRSTETFDFQVILKEKTIFEIKFILILRENKLKEKLSIESACVSFEGYVQKLIIVI